jgi:hypothetical protein
VQDTYLRFVTTIVNRESGRREGLFQAARDLADSNTLSGKDLKELRILQCWFGDNLKVPNRFARSRRSRAASRAISWYKSSATEYVSRMYSLCRILNDYGVFTEVISSNRPGYVVYEDEHQVAAEPYANTIT